MQILFRNWSQEHDMLKNIWNKLFTGPAEPQPDIYIIAQLNDKLEPIGRYEIYEQPLEEFLKQKWYGEVTGGGTLQTKDGEIKYCDLEIKLREKEINRQVITDLIHKLEGLGAPKGSKLIIEKTNEEIAFGKLEGLGLYLDGINLPDEVYKNSDPDALINDINKLLNIQSGDWVRYWQGNTETGFYFYGPSFTEMKNAIAGLLNSSPECENARVVQVA